MFTAFKRFFAVFIAFLLQVAFAICIRIFFRNYAFLIDVVFKVLSVFIVLAILKDSTKLSNDVPWIIIILLFPIFATILLVTLGKNYSRNKLMRSIVEEEEKSLKYLKQDIKVTTSIEKNYLTNLKYINAVTNYPVSTNNKLEYYATGADFYESLLKELKKAKKYIFMEYFIINKQSEMWDGVLDILKEKASEGVIVRVLYDDIGSIRVLSPKFPNELKKYGIDCITFNTLSPLKGIFMNNRDHRKITIIDGKVAFSGGVNISDEYINKKERYGIWKDNGIKIVGDAIWNLTVMFLNMWNANRSEDKDISKYKYDFTDDLNNGYVIPYPDGPLDEELVGENVYINMINESKKYLYIMTPYLIIDTDMINSLIRASKRGVDVRVIVPGIPDKKIAYTQTTSFFKVLHDNGIKIYKYKNGFIHSKVFLSDDNKSVVGTINLDYRSLYLHFENGIYMENVDIIKNILKDFETTFKECNIITSKDLKANFIKRAWQSILRLFAPLF